MSERYPGGFITKSPTAPTLTAAPGIWTLDQAMQYRKQNLWPWSPLPTSPAYAIDYDGTNDYLSKSSDLTGNANGKTFTFSAWVWWDGGTAGTVAKIGNLLIEYTSGADTLTITSSGGPLSASISTAYLPKNTFVHILISIDMANSSNRSVYINDVAQSVTWTTYTNSNITFTGTSHRVGADGSNAQKVKGRLSNVYLDYTYRDLSVTSNRRLFITSNLTPAAGQQGLNPIIYLPMDDPTTVGTNSGTGGNFVLNGTIARSGRGPNQYNVPYSNLDGAADYLSSTSVTGLSDGKAFTVSAWVNIDSLAANNSILRIGSTTSSARLAFYVTSTGFNIAAENSISTQILLANTIGIVTPAVGRNFHVIYSVDLSDTNKRHLAINGQIISPTWATYTNDTIDFSVASPRVAIGSRPESSDLWLNGRLGGVFFHTSYIDLSVAANLAKFVTGTGIDAKPVDPGSDGSLPLGVQPLIYLPMYGNNAGKNYGSGGDFTVNSGPYTGARGPNEFWGNKADFDGSTGYLYRTSALSGVSNGKTFSASFWINPDSGIIETPIFNIDSASTSAVFKIAKDSSGRIWVYATNSAGAVILDGYGSVLGGGVANFVQISIDLTNTAKRYVYFNGSVVSMTWTTYTNDTIQLSNSVIRIGAYEDGSSFLDGKLSEFYFTTEYIDFSQEANRLKFRDAFGNPVSLGADGSTPTGTAPAIYMRFDPASFGTNSGAGGNFTVNGTITDGGQL